MNKKRIGALLIGATLLVGALGSFAYFNGSTSTIGSNGDKNLQALQITNGQITVSAKVTGEGTPVSGWSYDVAKLSTDTNKEEEGIQYTAGDEYLSEDVATFENKHRSPDINVDEGQKDNSAGGNLKRAKIGAELPTEIKYTRPGDAIVLGVPQADGTTGLVVTNKSNLTVKMQLVVKTDENAKAMIKAMNDAGWIMYVDGEIAILESGNIVDLGVVAPGENSGEVSDIRFELPLSKNNDYQNKTNVNETLTQGLDLSQIIEIQATQENNGGWNEDGTGDRITK